MPFVERPNTPSTTAALRFVLALCLGLRPFSSNLASPLPLPPIIRPDSRTANRKLASFARLLLSQGRMSNPLVPTRIQGQALFGSLFIDKIRFRRSLEDDLRSLPVHCERSQPPNGPNQPPRFAQRDPFDSGQRPIDDVERRIERRMLCARRAHPKKRGGRPREGWIERGRRRMSRVGSVQLGRVFGHEASSVSRGGGACTSVAIIWPTSALLVLDMSLPPTHRVDPRRS